MYLLVLAIPVNLHISIAIFTIITSFSCQNAYFRIKMNIFQYTTLTRTALNVYFLRLRELLMRLVEGLT